MPINPVKISFTALIVSTLSFLVALTALLFGTDLVSRLQTYFHSRAAQERQQLEYLRDAVVFLDGLPFFIEETWAWGPSVPNYNPGRSFPNQGLGVLQEMPMVKIAVGEAMQMYYTHSHKQGTPYSSKYEALHRLSEIQGRFWHATELFLQSTWPWQWEDKLQVLRELRFSSVERENLLRLKRSKK
jgi:hypothetical protein